MTIRVRVGDLFLENRECHPHITSSMEFAQNVAASVLFPKVEHNQAFYIHKQPTEKPMIVGLPVDIRTLSGYEIMLIRKLLDPTLPVLVIEGPLGSGKTTTIRWLINNVILRMEHSTRSNDGRIPSCQGLIAIVDFRYERQIQITSAEEELNSLQRILAGELRARSASFITPDEEFGAFWDMLLLNYEAHCDGEAESVPRAILEERPALAKVSPGKAAVERKQVYDMLRQDARWYLRYMILLWRYLKGRDEDLSRCALVILDNLDTLHPRLQRGLLDLILSCAHSAGPLFVLLVRPESRLRLGLADMLADIVEHQGPEPFDVIRNRLMRYYANPDEYLRPDLGPSAETIQLLRQFLERVRQPVLAPGSLFSQFIKHAAGRSIRQAELLAQGLFLLTPAEMKTEEITTHFLVRACITSGADQYRWSPKVPVENLFNVEGGGNGRFLVKLSILKLLRDGGGRCSLSELRSALVAYGYTEDIIRRAINSLARKECQLIRTNGQDYFGEDWGDEQETVFHTEKGAGYLERLAHSIDYLQEVAMDCYVEKENWPSQISRDTLTEKLHVVYLLLRDIHTAECEQINDFIGRTGHARPYKKLFGDELLSLNLIQRSYPSVGRLLIYLARKYPHNLSDYRELILEYTSLLRVAEKANADYLGVWPEPGVEISLE